MAGAIAPEGLLEIEAAHPGHRQRAATCTCRGPGPGADRVFRPGAGLPGAIGTAHRRAPHQRRRPDSGGGRHVGKRRGLVPSPPGRGQDAHRRDPRGEESALPGDEPPGADPAQRERRAGQGAQGRAPTSRSSTMGTPTAWASATSGASSSTSSRSMHSWRCTSWKCGGSGGRSSRRYPRRRCWKSWGRSMAYLSTRRASGSSTWLPRCWKPMHCWAGKRAAGMRSGGTCRKGTASWPGCTSWT